MARRAEEEANHWPGFVDALSTIVMVITFLLILLGLTLFIMMQKIQSSANASDAQQDTEQSDGPSPALVAQTTSKSASADLQKQSSPEAPEGRSIPNKSDDLRQEEKIETQDKLTIITRKTEEKVRVKVISPERDTPDAPIVVTSAALSIEVTFSQDATRLDEQAAEQVDNALARKIARGETGQYEIRSIASSKVGSVSDAKRKAYYRALAMRNILLKRGVAANQIQTRVSMAQPGETDDRVIVVRKPM